MCLQINRRIYTTIAAMLTLCAMAVAQTPIRYVKTSGNYANDGTSWEQAKNNLQDAIESLHDYMTRNGITEGMWRREHTDPPHPHPVATACYILLFSYMKE